LEAYSSRLLQTVIVRTAHRNGGFMAGIILIIVILAYTGYVIYKKSKDVKAGKSCCGGCSSCAMKDKCKQD
jgi:hypothetical protein